MKKYYIAQIVLAFIGGFISYHYTGYVTPGGVTGAVIPLVVYLLLEF